MDMKKRRLTAERTIGCASGIRLEGGGDEYVRDLKITTQSRYKDGKVKKREDASFEPKPLQETHGGPVVKLGLSCCRKNSDESE